MENAQALKVKQYAIALGGNENRHAGLHIVLEQIAPLAAQIAEALFMRTKPIDALVLVKNKADV